MSPFLLLILPTLEYGKHNKPFKQGNAPNRALPVSTVGTNATVRFDKVLQFKPDSFQIHFSSAHGTNATVRFDKVLQFKPHSSS